MQDLDNWTLAYILPRVSVTLLVVTFIYQETFHAAEVESKHCKKMSFLICIVLGKKPLNFAVTNGFLEIKANTQTLHFIYEAIFDPFL